VYKTTTRSSSSHRSLMPYRAITKITLIHLIKTIRDRTLTMEFCFLLVYKKSRYLLIFKIWLSQMMHIVCYIYIYYLTYGEWSIKRVEKTSEIKRYIILLRLTKTDIIVLEKYGSSGVKELRYIFVLFTQISFSIFMISVPKGSRNKSFNEILLVSSWKYSVNLVIHENNDRS
jgi:hypothetical protein